MIAQQRQSSGNQNDTREKMSPRMNMTTSYLKAANV